MIGQDARIFKGIQGWESQKFEGMGAEEQQVYISDLQRSLGELKLAKGKILSKAANENKAWRYNADIMQLTWRLRYLSPLIKNSQSK